MRKGGVFPGMVEQHTTRCGDGGIVEAVTQDAGGPTRRCISEAWRQFWENPMFVGAVFDQTCAADGSGTHWHISKRQRSNELQVSIARFFGHLVFLVLAAGVVVHRPMTVASIAHALGSQPSGVRRDWVDQPGEKFVKRAFKEDMRACYPHVMGLCKLLRQAAKRSEKVQEAAIPEAVSLLSARQPDFLPYFGRLRTGGHLGAEVRSIQSRLQHEFMFGRCYHVGSEVGSGSGCLWRNWTGGALWRC